MKNIVILGSTGSIGIRTLEVIKLLGEEYRILGLSAQRNIQLLEKQIRQYHPSVVALMDEKSANELKAKSKELKVKVLKEIEGLKELASLPGSNFVVFAITGAIGLLPLLSAIKAGKTIALANKETLVIAGEIVLKEAKRAKVNILPLDSEHSAIFQCLHNENRKQISRIILTASGGPFYGFTHDQLKKVTVKQTLKHPQWKMGKKITVDSATLMNKGLETIEAHYLFSLPYEKIDILVHPQSIVHSFVEFVDGTLRAQLSLPDMRYPIQYALTYPERVNTQLPRLDWNKNIRLDFYVPKRKNFPCLDLAITCGKKGGTYPAVLNAADEVVVNAFLENRISFLDISKIVSRTLEKHKSITNPDLDDILSADRWARNTAMGMVLR